MFTNYFNGVIVKEEMQINIMDFKSYYPLLVFDVSYQSENLKSAPVDIRVKLQFNSSLSNDVTAYALILSDKIIKLASDGNKMNIIY